MPKLHRPPKKKKRMNIIDESVSVAKLANLPPRPQKLEKAFAKRDTAHNLIKQKAKERNARIAQKKKDDKKIEEEKKAFKNKFAIVIQTLKQYNFLKRDIPSIKQVRRYFRSRKGVSLQDSNLITFENVLSKWEEYHP